MGIVRVILSSPATLISVAELERTVPETAVPSLPYMFRSVDQMRHVMDGPIGDEILKAFETHDLVGLAFYDSGARSFYNTKKDISSIADLKGMKFRVIQSDVFVDMVNALGANATPMAYGEVYSALETGVIDGAENNWPSFESAKHYEVAKHYTVDQHQIVPEVLVMSKSSWDKLTPEDQAIVKQAAKDSVIKMRELWDAQEKKSREIVEKAGVKVSEIDKQPLIDAMKPVYDKYLKTPELKDLATRIQATK